VIIATTTACDTAEYISEIFSLVLFNLMTPQYAVSNWPADFDISAAYMPAQGGGGGASSSSSSVPESSSMAQYASGAWAAALIAQSRAKGNKGIKFQYPEGKLSEHVFSANKVSPAM